MIMVVPGVLQQTVTPVYILKAPVIPLQYYRWFTAAFDATVNNKKVDLFWITEAMAGNDHFEVERSFDQASFSTIGIVLGAQSKIGISDQYSFKDATPELVNHKVIYYRLKQVDI